MSIDKMLTEFESAAALARRATETYVQVLEYAEAFVFAHCCGGPTQQIETALLDMFERVRVCRNQLEARHHLFEVLYSRAGSSNFDNALDERSMCAGCSQSSIDTTRVLHTVMARSLGIVVAVNEMSHLEPQQTDSRQRNVMAKQIEEFYNDDCIIGLVDYCSKVVRTAEAIASETRDQEH